ncbi:response regulator [Azospirillum sp. Vi22]|uniref:response regulator n=1 Tax=Azospirillum baldaniorum TaxID=1064539 RepID=UPI00157AF851|nr:response regulator [Azospirillum baldaniorum]NUB10080.1 response regulator [Azospirillum baldaniorum]
MAVVLKGLRVLVVEDRGLIAGKITRALETAECVPVGPASTLKAGFDLLTSEGDGFGAAVLDIDLRGELVYPLAEALRARCVPMIFVTGFAASAIPEPWTTVHHISKPFRDTKLLACLKAALSGRPAQPAPSPAVLSDAYSRAVATVLETRNLIEETRILLPKRGVPEQD